MRFFHPTDLILSVFLSDELTPRARRHVAAHLGRCEKCFAYVAAMRSTVAIAAALPAPGPSEGVNARINARREAGDRVLLPTAEAGYSPASRRIALPLAAAAAALIAVAFFSSVRELPANAVESELTLSPVAPRARDTVGVTYRPLPSLFAGQRSLVLRARLRTPGDEAYSRGTRLAVIDTLTRDGSGAFRGILVLPDSVVFAALAVEDTEASVVDDRDGRPWEVMVHGDDGRPTFEALEQRESDYMGRSWEEAYATARRKAELYPDQFRSWSMLEFFERAVLGKAEADSAAKARRPEVQEILAAYMSAPTVPPEELASIVYRAWAQKDTAQWDYWWERIRRESPRHPETLEMAAVRVFRKYPPNPPPDRLLADYEEIWASHGPVTGSGHVIFPLALYAANKEKDANTYRRWARRLMIADPSVVRYYAGRFLQFPELREEGLGILREQLIEVDHDVRPLGRNRKAHARAIDQERRRIFAAIGRGLLDSGNQRGGLDTLALAVNEGWDLGLFQLVATGRMEAGDTAGALALGAKIAADPRTTTATRDSISELATRTVNAGSWRRQLEDARRFMIQTITAGSVRRLLPGEPQVTDGAGRPVPLRELIADKPALVVVWSRFCGPALEALDRIDSVATVLRGQGAATLLIVDEPPSAELTAFLRERSVATPVYHDTRREASQALRNFGTPAYYVFDRAGRIRFTWAPTEADLLLQVMAVREE